MTKTSSPIPTDDLLSCGWFQRLPSYSRSLLKIRVPVSVTLATTKLSIGDIVEMVPGTILQFEKMCDETLSLEVGGHRVAEGETVKVGDKFGLRLTAMILPAERFLPVRGQGDWPNAEQPSDASDAEQGATAERATSRETSGASRS